jgi:thioredoxin-related protein
MKNITIITLIFAIPILAYMILSKPDVSLASKTVDANKPQIMKFTSLMCLDCKKLDKVFKETYPSYNSKITLIEIPVQTETEYTKKQVQKYNITLVPTLVFITAKGKQLYKTEGYMPKAELEQKMKALINE